MQAFISELDLFVSTYPQGGGVSEVHAMALGVPVIGWVGDNGVIDTVIVPAAIGSGDTQFERAARTAFMTDAGTMGLPRASSADEFVRACVDLISDDERRDVLGRAGADFVSEHLTDTARFGDDVMTVLAECVRRGRGPDPIVTPNIRHQGHGLTRP